MNRARRRTVLRAAGYRLTQGPGGFTSFRDTPRRTSGVRVRRSQLGNVFAAAMSGGSGGSEG